MRILFFLTIVLFSPRALAVGSCEPVMPSLSEEACEAENFLQVLAVPMMEQCLQGHSQDAAKTQKNIHASKTERLQWSFKNAQKTSSTLASICPKVVKACQAFGAQGFSSDNFVRQYQDCLDRSALAQRVSLQMDRSVLLENNALQQAQAVAERGRLRNDLNNGIYEAETAPTSENLGYRVGGLWTSLFGGVSSENSNLQTVPEYGVHVLMSRQLNALRRIAAQIWDQCRDGVSCRCSMKHGPAVQRSQRNECID